MTNGCDPYTLSESGFLLFNLSLATLTRSVHLVKLRGVEQTVPSIRLSLSLELIL